VLDVGGPGIDTPAFGSPAEEELQRWRQHLEKAESIGTFFDQMLDVPAGGRTQSGIKQRLVSFH
jgi:hypothetical protein